MDISGISTAYHTANIDRKTSAGDSLQNSLKNISADSSEDELITAL